MPNANHLYITFYSKLKIIYPDGSAEDFNFENFDKDAIDYNTKKKIEIRSSLL